MMWLGSVALVAGAGLAVPTAAAAQAQGEGYADWTIGGAAGAYSGTMTLPPGFPAATWRSDSAGPAAVQSGVSTWLPAGVGFGAAYGSSQGQRYLNLRPAANNLASPSTTTYRFASPTPAGVWGFVIGDVDADTVAVSATGPDGAPLTGDQLGFQEAFNYCDASPRSAACSGQPAPGSPALDVPTADVMATSVLLTGNLVDTVGPAGWFQPTAPLSTLTVVMTWRVGIPVYQTWFAVHTRTISGTVTLDGTTPAPGVEVTLLDPADDPIASTTTGEDGRFEFSGIGPVDGYTVVITTPDGLEPAGPARVVVDVSTGDATGIDFGVTISPAGQAAALPVTGTPARLLAGAGLGLVLLGTAAIALIRRRRTD
jgi:Carboxypeptidase regulatory-like domain